MAGRKIWGVGVDVVEVSRFYGLLEAHGERFLKRAFHANEIELFNTRAFASDMHRCQHMAARWAAKEATLKAMGARILFPEVVVHDKTSQSDPRPRIEMQGAALALAKKQGITDSYLSMSHDGGMAVAHVILECGDSGTDANE